MSQENVELAKRFNRRRGTGTSRPRSSSSWRKTSGERSSWPAERLTPSTGATSLAFLALVDPDVEFGPLDVEMEGGGPYRGHDGLRAWLEDQFRVFPDWRRVEEIATWERSRSHGCAFAATA